MTHVTFLIDGPSQFASIEELLAHRREYSAMLVRYPNHPQWEAELETVEQLNAGKMENQPPFAQ